MVLDPDAAYRALLARDARFDGRLFVGVTSTGIYCRPVCRVRTPQRRHCRFFASAAQAEAASFRPCLKCRPEIAPGLSAMDSSPALAAAASRRIEQAVALGEPVSVAAVAAHLGITPRHLHRIFAAAHGVGPQDYLTTQRLLLAKRLLTDTAQPVGQVALASGFASLRRFNAAFAERYRMPPSRLRLDAGRAARDGTPVLRLAWRPPYDVAGVLALLARDRVAGVEEVDGTTWRRTLAVEHRGHRLAGWLACRFDEVRCEVALSVAPALAPALGAVIERVRGALDLDADPARIDAALEGLPAARTGTRVTTSVDGFEAAVRAVLAQQRSAVTARAATRRLVARLGRPLATPFAGLTHLFPSAQALAAAAPAALAGAGVAGRRAAAVHALADAVAGGRLALHWGAPLDPTLAALRAMPGIGESTVQVIAMRALGWPDAWPIGDARLPGAPDARDGRSLAALAERWRPWRAYAATRLQLLEQHR
jgi:AraC family transcriptional regulator of adaptative response / DNA-3-methyladenine glycosylase II